MPTFDSGKWVARIGPRLAFSERDGSFVVQDLRSRCITITVPDHKVQQGADPRSMLELLYFGVNNWNEIPRNRLQQFSAWLELSKLDDQPYTMWLLTLCGRIATDDEVFPTRIDQEAPRIEHATFHLVQVYKYADKALRKYEAWSAPPPGAAKSNGPWKQKESDIAVAQARPENAPELVWPQGKNRQSDANLDAWWEQAGFDRE